MGRCRRPILELETGLVNEAPVPIFARFERPHKRMSGVLEVRQSVVVGRLAATSNLSALLAHPKVDPRPAGAKAVFASVGRWFHILNRVEMRAFVRHREPPLASNDAAPAYLRHHLLAATA